MTTLRFQIEPALRVAQHSLKAPAQRTVAYTSTPVEKPAVVLVHDQGVYLMSNGLPKDEAVPGQPSAFCAFADGCNPTVDIDWWDAARALVGGDDFAETLEGWAQLIVNFHKSGAIAVKIRLTGKTMRLFAEFPRSARRAS